MAKAEITEREYNQLMEGMKEIVDSIKEFKKEVHDDISGLKTNVEVMKTTFVTKDLLIKVAAWMVVTFIAASAVVVAYLSAIPK